MLSDIELRAHMDLASLALPPNGLAVIPKTVRSIRVHFYQPELFDGSLQPRNIYQYAILHQPLEMTATALFRPLLMLSRHGDRRQRLAGFFPTGIVVTASYVT